MGATVKCVQPPAEARYDPEIVMDFAKRWGYEWNPSDPDNLWPDIQWQLDDSIKLLSDDEWPYHCLLYTSSVGNGRQVVGDVLLLGAGGLDFDFR